MRTNSPLLNISFVLGKKPFLAFGGITLLIVLLLSAVNITSHYAMARYVGDQIDRVPWDFSVYQTAEVPLSKAIYAKVKETAGVSNAEVVFFLRSVFPKTVAAVIDGQPLYTPWISILTASTPDLIPQDLRPKGNSAVLALVGSKAQMGSAFLNLQGKKQFDFRFVEFDGRAHLDEDNAAGGPVGNIPPLSLPIEKVIRIDGTELNRWFLENTSSPALIPELGLIVVMPFHPGAILAFDALARGGRVMLDDGSLKSTSRSEYYPDVIHLARADRDKLISAWDVEGSSATLDRIGRVMEADIKALSYSAAVDQTLGVMFKRIAKIARQIGLLSLLVSIPLLWMAWVLLGSVSGLLLMNERRNFGLMRLRGVPSPMIGRSLMLSIAAGGLIGGVAGAVLGTVLSILYYAGGWLPMQTVLKIQDPVFVLIFVAIALCMALVVSRRFVTFASTISPLAASGRINVAEISSGSVRFGPLQFLALLLGGYKVVTWIAGWSFAQPGVSAWVISAERIGDFIAFPLFVYGLITFVASRHKLLSALLAPTAWVVGGSMRHFARRHMELSRHRAAAFLLIVGLMSSLCLYPTVMSAVFDNKTERGALVQLGGELQLTLNALDLLPPEAQAKGALKDRAEILRRNLAPIVEKLRKLNGVRSANYVVEGLVEGLYMPGRGFSGIPLYLIGNPGEYLEGVYHEPQLGTTSSFDGLVRRLDQGEVLLSESMATYYKKSPGDRMPVGANAARKIEFAPFAGTVRFLPGMPLRTVNDREGFLESRIDYINYLFGENPYIVGHLEQENLGGLDVLMPRVVVALHAESGVDVERLKAQVISALPIEPLDVRTIDDEMQRLGSDMYIFLARENVRIYLIGGLLLALIGILAVAAANYADNRRTLGLLRIRGCGPAELFRFFAPGIVAPSLVGFVLGAGVALVVGYGITNIIWNLREIQTVLNYLGTHLAVSWTTGVIAFALILVVVLTATVFNICAFRRSAREGLSDR